jgi:hypothetical protein
LLYVNHEHLIETIANQKSYQYRNVGFFDSEDLKQEVRIKCWSVLHKYNPIKFSADLYVFLSVCAENRIRDIRRSIVYKHDKPCNRCPFWNHLAAQSGMHDCLIFFDKVNCDKYRKREKYVQAKLSSNHPIDIDDIDEENVIDKNSMLVINNFDFIDFVYASLEPDLIPIFDKLIDNNFEFKKLKPKEKKLLINQLKDILEEYRRENEQ